MTEPMDDDALNSVRLLAERGLIDPESRGLVLYLKREFVLALIARLDAAEAERDRLKHDLNALNMRFDYSLRGALIAYLDKHTSMDSRECIHAAGLILNFAREALTGANP